MMSRAPRRCERSPSSRRAFDGGAASEEVGFEVYIDALLADGADGRALVADLYFFALALKAGVHVTSGAHEGAGTLRELSGAPATHIIYVPRWCHDLPDARVVAYFITLSSWSPPYARPRNAKRTACRHAARAEGNRALAGTFLAAHLVAMIAKLRRLAGNVLTKR